MRAVRKMSTATPTVVPPSTSAVWAFPSRRYRMAMNHSKRMAGA